MSDGSNQVFDFEAEPGNRRDLEHGVEQLERPIQTQVADDILHLTEVDSAVFVSAAADLGQLADKRSVQR